MLTENIKKYWELMNEEEELKKRKEELKSNITDELNDLGETSFTTEEGLKASLIEKQTFKYVNEPAIIKYLQDNGLTSYIETKVRTTALNKELKKKTTLNESLNPFYNETISIALKVENKDENQ